MHIVAAKSAQDLLNMLFRDADFTVSSAETVAPTGTEVHFVAIARMGNETPRVFRCTVPGSFDTEHMVRDLVGTVVATASEDMFPHVSMLKITVAPDVGAEEIKRLHQLVQEHRCDPDFSITMNYPCDVVVTNQPLWTSEDIVQALKSLRYTEDAIGMVIHQLMTTTKIPSRPVEAGQ